MNGANDLLSLLTSFRVEGYSHPGGPLTWRLHRFVGGLFTADVDAVSDRLPAPGLHPLRWRPGRALLMVEGVDAHLQRQGLPPTRLAFLAVSAMVAVGDRPAPAMLPLLSDRIGKRYCTGLAPLLYLMANPVEAQLYTQQFGFPARTADVEYRRGDDVEEFAALHDGHPLMRLRVRTDGRVGGTLPVIVLYGVRDGTLLRLRVSNPDPGATRVGRHAAALHVSHHPAVADLRKLGASTSSWMGFTKCDSRWRAETPPEVLRRVPSPSPPTDAGYQAGHFSERVQQRQATPIDLELDHLPFDPAATITVPPLPLTHPVAG